MSPARLHDRLIRVEVSGRYEPDCRRVISHERMMLGVALRSGDAQRIAAASTEAARVAEMWGVL